MAEDDAKKIRKSPINKLNDLSGSSWVYFLNSVWLTNYRRTGKGSHGYDLRKEHPSPKPPELLEEIIRFFTKEGGKVLDPFAGVGSSLLACSLAKRFGVGVEINEAYAQIYRLICAREPAIYSEMPLLVGDSRHIAEIEQVLINAPFDLVIADPPYADMVARMRTKGNGGQGTPYTDQSNDLGNIQPIPHDNPPYKQYLLELASILTSTTRLLKRGGHLVLFCKDYQPTDQHHNMLHADLIISMREVKGLQYKGMRIWANLTPKLYPFGYPHGFVANQIHQYVLIFRLEEK